MRKYWLIVFFLFYSYSGYGQAYIPMPVDSGAAWRYRIYDIDYITHVFDFILFLNGEDTVIGGNVYHKIITRSAEYVVPNGSDPPVISLNATSPDTYYGAMRESNKKVYQVNTTGTGEILMFDFNAAVGDSIPAYAGMCQVTGIDSIIMSGVYHKRYLTTDSTYFTIEGVGCNKGLIPQLNDGGTDIAFYCFTNSFVTYSPDTTIPCTYIYPIGYTTVVTTVLTPHAIEIYPIPANDILHIKSSDIIDKSQAFIINYLGQKVWSGAFEGEVDIPINSWPRGIYSFRLNKSGKSDFIMRKFIVE